MAKRFVNQLRFEAAWKRHEQSRRSLPPIEARPRATSGSDPAKSGEPQSAGVELGRRQLLSAAWAEAAVAAVGRAASVAEARRRRGRPHRLKLGQWAAAARANGGLGADPAAAVGAGLAGGEGESEPDRPQHDAQGKPQAAVGAAVA